MPPVKVGSPVVQPPGTSPAPGGLTAYQVPLGAVPPLSWRSRSNPPN